MYTYPGPLATWPQSNIFENPKVGREMSSLGDPCSRGTVLEQFFTDGTVTAVLYLHKCCQQRLIPQLSELHGTDNVLI